MHTQNIVHLLRQVDGRFGLADFSRTKFDLLVTEVFNGGLSLDQSSQMVAKIAPAKFLCKPHRQRIKL